MKLLFAHFFSSPFVLKTEQLKENQKLSKEEVSCTLKRIQELEVSTTELKIPFVLYLNFV